MPDPAHLDLSCYTFGAPRTGNHAFAHEYNELVPDTWGIINDQASCVDVPGNRGAVSANPARAVVPAADIFCGDPASLHSRPIGTSDHPAKTCSTTSSTDVCDTSAVHQPLTAHLTSVLVCYAFVEYFLQETIRHGSCAMFWRRLAPWEAGSYMRL